MSADWTLINYTEFIKSATILECDAEKKDPLVFYCENTVNPKVDGIMYSHVDNFLLMNTAFLPMDNNGHYFFQYEIPHKKTDIIVNSTLIFIGQQQQQQPPPPPKITYQIYRPQYGYIEYPTTQPIPLLCAQYCRASIRITFFNKPNIEDEIKIKSEMYLLNNNNRKRWNELGVNVNGQIYRGGILLNGNNLC